MLKVVIEDIEYEIYLTQSYVENLNEEIKRLNEIKKYEDRMNKSKKEKDKNYYLEGINLLLKENETLENLSLIFEEYKKL